MLIEAFAPAGLVNAQDDDFDVHAITLTAAQRATLVGEQPDVKAEAMLRALDKRGVKSVFVRFLTQLEGHPTADGVLAAIAATVAWGPLMRKRISRLTAECLPWWIKLLGRMIGASVPVERHEANRFCGMGSDEILDARSLTEVAFVALLGKTPLARSPFKRR